MANRYWVGGTANWDATAGTKWSTTSGGAGGSAVPTAADDVYIDAYSGSATVTIPTSTTISARSINFVDGTGGAFAGTLALPNSVTSPINIGDGTAGAGNVAIKFSSGMTITSGGTGNVMNLVSTSATQQTITFNGKSFPGSFTINGSGSSYILGSDFTLLNTNGQETLTITNGTFDTANYNLDFGILSSASGTRTITLGSSTITLRRNGSAMSMATTGSLTMTANTASFTSAQSPTLSMGGVNMNGASFTFNGGGASVMNGGSTWYNITKTGQANKTDALTIAAGTTVTCTGTFTCNGNSSINRVLVQTETPGTAGTINAATVSVTNSDFRDITGAGAGSWDLSAVSGLSGDCGGNSGITFTTAASQQYDGTAGNWSTAARWTSRVPLPQDDVTFATSSAAVSIDMPRCGKNVNFTNYTGTLTWTTTLGQTFYGSLTLSSGMTNSFGNTVNWVLAGRGSFTFDSAGKTFTGTNMSTTIAAPGGTYTLASAYTTGHSISVLAGTFTTSNYTVTSSSASSTGTITRTINLGSSTWNLTVISATPWTASGSGLTLNSGTSNFVISTTSASTRTFAGGGYTYNQLTYTVAGSAGQLTITGSNTFGTLSFSDVTNARTLALTAGTTQTLTSESINGTSGKLMSIVSATAASPAYIHYIGAPQTHDYVSVQDIYSVIPRKMYCTNSTNVSGNLNVTFSAGSSEPYILWQANTTGSGATTNITLPYATTAGDLIVAGYGNSSNGTGTITPPTGFTLDKGASAATSMRIYSKVADGTETTLTWTTTLAPAVTTIQLYIIRDTGYTASVDVTDSNSGSSITALSTGAGATNTTTRALAIGMYQGSGTMGASVSATNSWEWVRPSTEVTTARTIIKPLSSTASQTSTYTWTTSRNADAEMVVYKFAVSSTFQPMTAMFM